MRASGLPSGTVTFLFTDIEGSTRLLQELGDRYAELLAQQREIVRRVLAEWEGNEVDTQGDAFFYSFTRASQALNAAVEVQREIRGQEWPTDQDVRVRIGLHTGEPLRASEGYVGMDVHRAARIAHAGHGGQILLSETTTALIVDQLPQGCRLIELGRHRLKDIPRPERISLAVLDRDPAAYPPLKSLQALPPEPVVLSEPRALPEYLQEEASHPPVFVGREREQDWLMTLLEKALAGQGGMGILVGGPGRGKTALLESFSRKSSHRHPELALAWGECSAYTGRGDPYHPFRQIFRTLTGDLEPLWKAQRISHSGARQMWENFPATMTEIVESGPDLIGPMLSGQSFLKRWQPVAAETSAWRERLDTLLDQGSQPGREHYPSALFEHINSVLSKLAQRQPLVIVLDDLQWIDRPSVDLLFALSRVLNDRRILILGAYRPEEVALGRGDDEHPLKSVMLELRRSFGEIALDLGRLPHDENRSFIELYLDSEPNQLDRTFRDRLFEHTEGHPLFTVELIRSMAEKGELRRDDSGRWVTTEALRWDRLPARVEGVIEERLSSLDPDLRRILEVAAVEGEQFTVQVVAEVLKIDEAGLYEILARRLGDEHRLIREFGGVSLNGQRLARYGFEHSLYQQYIYRSIEGPVRARFHALAGSALERLYASQATKIASQLARHFRLGNISEKAVQYAIKAGDQARLAHAYREGVKFYEQALALLEGSGQADLIARTLLKLGLIYNAQGEHRLANTINQQAFELWEPLRRGWERERYGQAGATLSISIEEPQTLDPGLVSDEASIFVVNQLFEGLVTVDVENNVLPGTAESWEILDAGNCYQFKLRKGQTWSDGTPLTARHFEFAWRRNLELAQKSPAAHLLYVIKSARQYASRAPGEDGKLGIRVLDDQTLEVELEAPIAYLPHLLTHPVAFPLSENDERFQEGILFDLPSPRTNGPYVLGPGSAMGTVELERNPHYSGGFSGNIVRARLTVMDGYATAFDRFDEGEFEVVSLIRSDPATVRQASRRYGANLRFVPQLSTFYVNFCCAKYPFDSAAVRQAFVLAVDREVLISETSHGQYNPALGGFLPPGMPGHQPEAGLGYEPDRARALMTESGYRPDVDQGTIEFLFTGPERLDLIEFLAESWRRELGVSVDLRNASWESFVERMNGDPPELSVMGFMADYPDPDALLRVLFHSTEGYNQPSWANRRFDELVERAGRLLDPEARIQCYQEADRILVMGETAVMPLGYALSRSLIRPGIQVPPVPAGRLRLKDIVG